MSQLALARSVNLRCRNVCGVSSFKPVDSAIDLNVFDHDHMDKGFPQLRLDSDRKRWWGARDLTLRRKRKYSPNREFTALVYGTRRSRLLLATSARTRSNFNDGSKSSMRR